MNKKLMIYIALLLLGISYSCKKDLPIKTEETSIAETKIKVNSYNPYSLANMRKAFASLLMKDVQLMANNKMQYAHGKIMATNSTATLTINKSLTAKESVTLTEKELLATHYYIKFMPANEAAYAKL